MPSTAVTLSMDSSETHSFPAGRVFDGVEGSAGTMPALLFSVLR
jgi:hypothetical protein